MNLPRYLLVILGNRHWLIKRMGCNQCVASNAFHSLYWKVVGLRYCDKPLTENTGLVPDTQLKSQYKYNCLLNGVILHNRTKNNVKRFCWQEICQEKCIDAGGRFTPSSLQTLVKDQGLNLGLVIDLTFTDRYYHPGVSIVNTVQFGQKCAVFFIRIWQ